jgi:exosortase H (IPTLxxWG-CTERM-specific)
VCCGVNGRGTPLVRTRHDEEAVMSKRESKTSDHAIGRFIVTAVAMLGIFFVVLTQLRFSEQHLIAPYTVLLARSMSVILGVAGLSPAFSGTSVTASGFSATIVPSCAGIEIMALLAASMLAFPASVRRKVSGVLLGLVAVHLINVARLVVLFLIGIHFRSGFDQAHYYYAQGFLLLATVGIWALWVTHLPRYELARHH